MKLNELEDFEGEEAIPEPESMIESFRSVGYDLETAVADIIDNSIAAGASNVWVDFDWKGDQSLLSISDDGSGMSESDLIRAMRPGSKNPLTDRNPQDLGRFGLGLKTASFSQCRVLTVATRKDGGEITSRCWNLDYVGHKKEWRLLKYLDKDISLARLQKLTKGTMVIWQDIDRLVKKNAKSDKDLAVFLDKIAKMEKHLQMVFHIFIQTKRLIIRINGKKITDWDPYIQKKSRQSDSQVLRDGIQVTAYVLPHHTKLSREEFENASWIKGWNANQGFYIYRQERMIIAGEWLGMYKQEEHSKLARIMVNVPNTAELDAEWQLDIKKSHVLLPHDIRQKLKSIADHTKKEAVEIYRQLGKTKRGKSHKKDIPVWLPHKWNGKRCYQINQEHPLIKRFISEQLENKTKLTQFFKLIEETLPLAMIIINESENPQNQNVPFEGKSISDLVILSIDLFQTLLEDGYSKEEAIEEILRTEPFNYYPELTETLSNASN